MKEGSFSEVIRTFETERQMEIELSMNKLVDRDDYFGLVQVEPEP